MSALIMGTIHNKDKTDRSLCLSFWSQAQQSTDSGIATEKNQVECGCRLQRVMV